MKDKEKKIFKAEKNDTLPIKKTIRMKADFVSETMEARKKWQYFSGAETEKKL